MSVRQESHPRLQRIESLAVLEVAGADAAIFLNGQLSNDVTALVEGDQQLTSFNSPKGRVIAVLTLQLERDRLLAALPRELADALLDRLRKYVLRSKVSLRVASELAAFASPSEPAHLAFEGTSTHPPTQSSPDALDTWKRALIAAGRPQVYPATSEQFVAQMLNLDLVGGISFRKGCYTGQEIIARTQNLGRIKRRMLRFSVPGTLAIAPGTQVQLGVHGAGTVVDSVSGAAGGCELLAVVHLEPQAADARDGALALDAKELSLPYTVKDR